MPTLERKNSVTRTVHRKVCYNGERANWRLDYCSFKGLSFAQFVKRGLRGTEKLGLTTKGEIAPSEHSVSKQKFLCVLTNI